jgi:REP element-mobilizing transposase RayT
MGSIIYYKHLPHYQPAEATFFVTYRLACSLPVLVIQNLKDEFHKQTKEVMLKVKDVKLREEELYKTQKRYFAKFDDHLDKNLNESYWLKNDTIAGIVADSLHFLADSYFELWAYCIMSNHVHLLISMHANAPILYKVMQRHKSFTATQCNKVLRRHGPFWTRESYDHVVRKDDEFGRIVAYILNNPVKAGLIENWQEWKWSYVNPKL